MRPIYAMIVIVGLLVSSWFVAGCQKDKGIIEKHQQALQDEGEA